MKPHLDHRQTENRRSQSLFSGPDAATSAGSERQRSRSDPRRSAAASIGAWDPKQLAPSNRWSPELEMMLMLFLQAHQNYPKLIVFKQQWWYWNQ